MTNPRLLLWESQRGVLLVTEWDKRGQNVVVLGVGTGGRPLNVIPVHIRGDIGMWIESWCLNKANTLLCFSYNKKEILESDLKDNCSHFEFIIYL